jgi:hypothetical protein
MAQIAPLAIASGHSPLCNIVLETNPERRNAGAGVGDVTKCT